MQASTTIWLQKAIIWASLPPARTQGYYLQKWTSVLCLIHSSNICTCTISSFPVWMFLCCMGSLKKFVHIILSLSSIRFFKFQQWLSNLSILHFLPNENFQLLQNLFQNIFSSRTFHSKLHLIMHFIWKFSKLHFKCSIIFFYFWYSIYTMLIYTIWTALCIYIYVVIVVISLFHKCVCVFLSASW